MMRKQYTSAWKRQSGSGTLEGRENDSPTASEYEVHPIQLKNWMTIALEGMTNLFEKQDSTAELKAGYER